MNLCGLILQKRLADRLSGVSANGIQFIIHAAFPPEARSHRSSSLMDIHGVTSVVFCGILAINISAFISFVLFLFCTCNHNFGAALCKKYFQLFGIFFIPGIGNYQYFFSAQTPLFRKTAEYFSYIHVFICFKKTQRSFFIKYFYIPIRNSSAFESRLYPVIRRKRKRGQSHLQIFRYLTLFPGNFSSALIEINQIYCFPFFYHFSGGVRKNKQRQTNKHQRKHYNISKILTHNIVYTIKISLNKKKPTKSGTGTCLSHFFHFLLLFVLFLLFYAVLRMSFKSSSTVFMGLMSKFLTKKASMFGEMNAGNDGPSRMPFIPKESRDRRMTTAFCSYQERISDRGREFTSVLKASARAKAIFTAE